MCTRGRAAGNVIATKLRHLNAQAIEALASSGDGQQQSMSVWSAIAISGALTESVGEPHAGANVTETAIKRARNRRTKVMAKLSGPKLSASIRLDVNVLSEKSALGQKRICAAHTLMAAKGQKQTLATQKLTSALLPIATKACTSEGRVCFVAPACHRW